MTKIACLLLGLMLSVPLAAQKTYYMDPEGEDTNPGTESKPFATIMKVQDMTRKVENENEKIIGIIQVGLQRLCASFMCCCAAFAELCCGFAAIFGNVICIQGMSISCVLFIPY